MFESRVILDGSQTIGWVGTVVTSFESRVILDGSQTIEGTPLSQSEFESRVILDGSQTYDDHLTDLFESLRVVLF